MVYSGEYTEPKGRCVRAIMLFFSTLTMIVGVAIFGFAVYLYISKSDIISGVYLIGLMLSIGFFIFLIASLGFCGAYQRSLFWLYCYSFVVLLLIIAEITLVIIVTTNVIDLDTFVEDRWADLDNDSRVTVQDRFHCCGYPGYNEDIGIPCPTLDEALGCSEALEDYIDEFMLECAIVAGCVAFLEIMMFTLGCCLSRVVRKQRVK